MNAGDMLGQGVVEKALGKVVWTADFSSPICLVFSQMLPRR